MRLIHHQEVAVHLCRLQQLLTHNLSNCCAGGSRCLHFPTSWRWPSLGGRIAMHLIATNQLHFFSVRMQIGESTYLFIWLMCVALLAAFTAVLGSCLFCCCVYHCWRRGGRRAAAAAAAATAAGCSFQQARHQGTAAPNPAAEAANPAARQTSQRGGCGRATCCRQWPPPAPPRSSMRR